MKIINDRKVVDGGAFERAVERWKKRGEGTEGVYKPMIVLSKTEEEARKKEIGSKWRREQRERRESGAWGVVLMVLMNLVLWGFGVGVLAGSWWGAYKLVMGVMR